VFPFESLGMDRFDMSPCSDAGGWRADSVQEVAIRAFSRKKDLIVGGWPPSVGQRLAKAVDNAFGERIERHRVEPSCVFRAAPLAHASRKIRGGVALETDREDTLWAGRAARLQQIAGALR
jgi:hypothetical protein